jgi:acyl-CoA reductase-like NAD-dependent aldehyde dehydrogenase
MGSLPKATDSNGSQVAAAFRLLIGGRLVDGDATMPVINPASEDIVAIAPRASRTQLDDAAASAASAFPAWSCTPLAERKALLRRIADLIELNAEPLGRILTLEQGKPLREAVGEARSLAELFRYFTSLDLSTKTLATGAPQVQLVRKPLGVVAAIIPWNYPLYIIGSKLPPALLAGNTVILKPAPTTPLATLRLGEILADVLPRGVLNVITGADDLGDYLTQHPKVRMISFTGSTATGRRIMANAAQTIKRLTLELGGNDAAIVLEDVDPREIAPKIFDAAFANCGQLCCAIKRLYVHESVYEVLCDELARLARAAVIGDGMSEKTQLGPLQNRRQFQKIMELLGDAARHGIVVCGGETFARGYFMRPAIVRDIAEGTRLVDEEQFGPVLPVIKFSDPEDALRRANASPYGLGASVWSQDLKRAHALAQRMEAGTVWINSHADTRSILPSTGAKQSGFGIELGEEGLAEFTQLQVVSAAAAPRDT